MYGSNFEFRVHPTHGERAGRYVAEADLAIGAPVEAGAAADMPGALLVNIPATQAAPVLGMNGIAVYEHGPVVSDCIPVLGVAPAGKMVQVVSGPSVKVVLRNTDDRLMVDLTGMDVGDLLAPVANGDDTAGYWEAAAVPADAWLVITHIAADLSEAEARLTF